MKQQTANSKQQTANSKQQTANSKQQTANSKRYYVLLILTNILTLVFLSIISLHYKVPQRVLNRLGITHFELRVKNYAYYRIQAVHSLGSEKEGFEIIMLGDSITEGGNWEQLLNGSDVANYGIGGDTTTGLLYRLSDVYMAKPQKVFLMIGINDLLSGISVDKIVENIEEIITSLREHGIDVILQSTLYVARNNWEEINNNVTILNGKLLELSNQYKLYYLDLNKVLSKDKALERKYTKDGLHLLNNGYKEWQKIIKNLLTDA
jgi:lysophospholipase L1-like esterase